MIPQKLEHTISNIMDGIAKPEAKLLKTLTGRRFPVRQSREVLTRVQEHKWYLSERLGRDVGLRVAAIDYIENFH
jgi:hypothetical protein